MVGIADGGKVRALPKARDEEAEFVVSVLEDALAHAQENPCHTVCVFLMRRDGMNDFFDGAHCRTMALGTLVQLQHQLLREG